MINSISNQYKTKVAIYYNQLLHTSIEPYKPNPNFREYTNKLLELLETRLPKNHSQMQLADIGSGYGLYSALLSPLWKSIISVEPFDVNVSLQSTIIKKLNIKNVSILNNSMPNCFYDIRPDSVIMIESLYTSQDWLLTFETMLENDNLKWFCITDGPDDFVNKPFNNYGIHRAYDDKKRRPFVAKDEFKLMSIAKNNDFTCTLMDLYSFEEYSKNKSAENWVLIGEKNG